MSDFLPIPKKFKSWMIAIFFICVLYFLYYGGGGYNDAFAKYKENYFPAVEATQNAYKDDSVLGDITVKMNVPKSFSPEFTNWVYFEVSNLGERLVENIWLWIETDDESNGAQIAHLAGYVADVSDPSIQIEQIRPGAKVFVRVPLNVQTINKSIITVKPYIGVFHGEEFISYPLSFTKTLEKIKTDRISSFRVFLIQNLLIPPWSNIIFPLLIIFICWVAEELVENSQRNRPQYASFSEFLFLFITTLWLLVIFLSITRLMIGVCKSFWLDVILIFIVAFVGFLIYLNLYREKKSREDNYSDQEIETIMQMIRVLNRFGFEPEEIFERLYITYKQYQEWKLPSKK